VTTAEGRIEERRVAKTRVIEMILDEDWGGILETAVELRRRFPGIRLPAERWGDWAAIREHVERSVVLALASVDPPVPDGLEDAALAMHHRATGTQLRVGDVDTGQRIIELSGAAGVSVYYRWHLRDGGSGFLFERTDRDGCSP